MKFVTRLPIGSVYTASFLNKGGKTGKVKILKYLGRKKNPWDDRFHNYYTTEIVDANNIQWRKEGDRVYLFEYEINHSLNKL
jgi:hypothetical protein